MGCAYEFDSEYLTPPELALKTRLCFLLHGSLSAEVRPCALSTDAISDRDRVDLRLHELFFNPSNGSYLENPTDLAYRSPGCISSHTTAYVNLNLNLNLNLGVLSAVLGGYK